MSSYKTHTIISLWTHILHHLFQHSNSVKGVSGIFQITEMYSHPPTLYERTQEANCWGLLRVLSVQGSRIKTLN